ncbi:MAG: alpha/beta fold hydrolase [Bdellovibrionales bacterium]|nr:alpha/beta fold hydrolase [Bdellovibrionales bacterium]
MLQLTLALLILCCSFAQAIPEQNFDATYRTSVLPFYNSGRQAEMIGAGKVRLRYIAFDRPQARAVVLIVPGYNESFRKYAELAYDLFQSGYAVYALDHRGQGASQRFLSDSHKGYVDLFSRYVQDLKTFADTVVPRNRPRYLLAHSMGGAIATYYLESYPHDFRAAALSAPMLEINLGRDENLASMQLLALMLIGRARSYAPGTGDYDPSQIPFEANTVTHSRARYLNNRAILTSHPELFLAGQTVRWVFQSIHGSYLARTNAARIRTPVLLLQAGQDELVLPHGQEHFCRQAKGCRLHHLSQARHEILQETDALRTPALNQILSFFRAN